VLENGCLCCTIRSDLVGTLNSLYHARQAGEIPTFDNVVIETSGLAEPGPVLQAFLSEPTLDGLYRVASVLTLVDAVNWPGTSEAHEEAVRQVALADQIRITKLDMVIGDRQNGSARMRLDLRRINPSAEIAEVDWSSDVVAKLLTSSGFDSANSQADPRPWLNVEAYQNTAHDHVVCGGDDHLEHDYHGHDHTRQAPGHHLEGKGIENFVLTRERPLVREEAQFLLDGIAQNLGPALLRVKGLVNIAEEPGRPAVIQGAQHLLHTMTWLDRWPDDDHRTRIVFITQGIPKENLKDIVDLLDRVSSRTFKARLRGRGAAASTGWDAR
jgi:G3E family GTPase